MKRKEWIKKIIYGFAALTTLVVCLWIASKYLLPYQLDKYEIYDCLVFGDSQMALGRDETSVTENLSRLTGKRIFNAALGGTELSYTESDERLAYTKDCYTMCGLSASILTGDFRVQSRVPIRESATEYFGLVINELEVIDFQKVQMVLIQHMLNDYHAGIPLENPQDPFDQKTYAGAMRTVVKRLKKVNPNLRIVLVSSTYTWYIAQGITCEEYVINGHILEDFVQKQEELARELDLEFIDLYHGLYEHGEWEDWERYTDDGLHPNERGREEIAGKIAEYLEAHP